MTTQQVADRLVALCREHKYLEAMEQLYSPDILSIEPSAGPGGESPESRGIDAVKKKGEWWTSNHTIHESRIEGPVVAGTHFCVRFFYDITQKATGNRFNVDELAVYQVKDGKIVREQFFYAMG